MNIIVPGKEMPKGAFRLTDNPTRQALVWKNVVRNEKTLATHVRVGQRTMRLMGLIPTWEALMQTEYFHEMASVLDSDELRKYQAWWECIYEISDGKDLPKGKALFMLALLVREQLRRGYGKELMMDPRKYQLDEGDEERIKEATLSRFEDLTRQ
jgi:hypothetical protein